MPTLHDNLRSPKTSSTPQAWWELPAAYEHIIHVKVSTVWLQYDSKMTYLYALWCISGVDEAALHCSDHWGILPSIVPSDGQQLTRSSDVGLSQHLLFENIYFEAKRIAFGRDLCRTCFGLLSYGSSPTFPATLNCAETAISMQAVCAWYIAPNDLCPSWGRVTAFHTRCSCWWTAFRQLHREWIKLLIRPWEHVDIDKIVRSMLI